MVSVLSDIYTFGGTLVLQSPNYRSYTGSRALYGHLADAVRLLVQHI
jgi:hypothetical protein